MTSVALTLFSCEDSNTVGVDVVVEEFTELECGPKIVGITVVKLTECDDSVVGEIVKINAEGDDVTVKFGNDVELEG